MQGHALDCIQLDEVATLAHTEARGSWFGRGPFLHSDRRVRSELRSLERRGNPKGLSKFAGQSPLPRFCRSLIVLPHLSDRIGQDGRGSSGDRSAGARAAICRNLTAIVRTMLPIASPIAVQAIVCG